VIEDRFLFLLSVAGSTLESSKSGIEETLKKQLDSIREALLNLNGNVFNSHLPKLVSDLKFRLRILSVLSTEFLTTKSPQLISRRDEISKSLLGIIRVPILARFDILIWRQILHVFGVLISSDSDRFSMVTPPYQKADRPPFKKALSDILNPTVSETFFSPSELRLRIEHAMPSLSTPAFKAPVKLPDLSSATFDNIDPWILLEEQPEPVLMSKIEKGDKPIQKQELTFAKTLFQQKRGPVVKQVSTPGIPAAAPTPNIKLATPREYFISPFLHLVCIILYSQDFNKFIKLVMHFINLSSSCYSIFKKYFPFLKSGSDSAFFAFFCNSFCSILPSL